MSSERPDEAMLLRIAGGYVSGVEAGTVNAFS